jgi:4-hydroxythreonine-4-phosphate dehydrogenase
MNSYKIGITMGDVNGVGPEVIVKMLADSRMTELFTPVIYGSSKVLGIYKKELEGAEGFQYTQITSPSEARHRRVNVVNCTDDIRLEPGKATPEAGKAAVDTLMRAAADLKAGLLDAIVTAPINKENVQEAGFGFTGHTEFFAAQFGGEPVMILCSELLRVGLVTTHLPIAEVSASITRERVAAQILRLRDSMMRDFGIVAPRIAVLALNPHSGDGGVLGGEEQDVIKPAILDAMDKGALAFGPMPADGFFAAASYTKYDAVLAMYHDQGLTPFKTLTPWGVNFTAGLPVVRTSPDHGVAYDIAGHGVADERSIREAVYAAIDILNNRRLYAEMTANPLKRYERERAGADMSASDLPEEPEPQD